MPPTSERSFDAARNQTVTTQAPPIYADFALPEIQDLRKIPKRTVAQADALERKQPGTQLGQAPGPQPNYYEPIYGQPGAGPTAGGIFPWEAGQPFGMQTAPVALGTRRRASGSGGGGGSDRGPSMGGVTNSLDLYRALTDTADAQRANKRADYMDAMALNGGRY